MPYIPKVQRPLIDRHLKWLLECGLTAGQINYIITKLLVAYVNRRGLGYESFKDVDGILGTCAKEFYRRVTAPYEDKKRFDPDNGDVFD